MHRLFNFDFDLYKILILPFSYNLWLLSKRNMCDLLKRLFILIRRSWNKTKNRTIYINDNGFKTISPPFSGYFSTFPHGTLYAIGLNEYLVFGVNAPGFLHKNLNSCYFGNIWKIKSCFTSSLSLSRVLIPKHSNS